MKQKLVALIACALALSACAEGSTMADSGQVDRPIPAGKSRIVVYRPGILGTAIQPTVHVDGRTTGKCTPKGAFSVEVAPGSHKVSASTEVEKSVTVETRRGQTEYVKCSIGFGVFVGQPHFEHIAQSTGRAESASMVHTGSY